MGTVTGAWTFPGVSSPLSVWSTPFVIVVAPPVPLSEAEHVASKEVAVKISPMALVMLLTVALLVTDPVGPGVPWVLTVISPEVKNRAGPAPATPDGAVAVIGAPDPPAGSVTVGVGTVTLGGPPKRPTLAK